MRDGHNDITLVEPSRHGGRVVGKGSAQQLVLALVKNGLGVFLLRVVVLCGAGLVAVIRLVVAS